MRDKRALVDLGKVQEMMIIPDMKFPVHIRDTVTLDHDIDGDLLAQAWERTKRVYPLVDTVLGYDRDPRVYAERGSYGKYPRDHAYLVEPAGGESVPLESVVPVAPCSQAAGGRPVCVSYYGRRITLSCFHSFVDGAGMLKILSTLVYCYLALHTGHEDEHPVVDLQEGREPAQYYTPVNGEFVYAQPFTPTPLYTLPLGVLGYQDVGLVYGSKGGIPQVLAGSMDVSVEDFMRLCKSNGANPSAMLCALLARATFLVNPEEAEDLVCEVTVSMRKDFGLEESIANCFGTAVTYVLRSEVEDGALAEVSRRIRADVTSQRGKDYFLSRERTFSMYDCVKSYAPRTVTYRGTFDIGENNAHVRDFVFETGAKAAIYFTQLNDRFVLSVQHGMVTDAYLRAFERLFAELGVEATISHPTYAVTLEPQAPVLSDDTVPTDDNGERC